MPPSGARLISLSLLFTFCTPFRALSSLLSVGRRSLEVLRVLFPI